MPQMYHVTWSIDLEAGNPVEAAEEAWRLMRNEGSIANVFMVQEHDTSEALKVDLTEVEEGGACRTCGQPKGEGGDGYDDECADCASNEQECRHALEEAGWRRATDDELARGFKPFQHRHTGSRDAHSWADLADQLLAEV